MEIYIIAMPNPLMQVLFLRRANHIHNKAPKALTALGAGASDLTRTGDLLITSEMHYRLCYTSVFCLDIISGFRKIVNCFFHIYIADLM